MRRRDLFAFPFFLWPFRRDPSIAGIQFREVRKGPDRRRYIWIHGDERTALEVLEAHLKAGAQGRAFYVHSDGRNVPLLGGVVDPNRIFSREGAERSVRTLNPSWSDEQRRRALDELDDDRPGFLRRLLPRADTVLIALHNNGAGYSIKDEVEISDAVAMQDPDHPDEFMLCTRRVDFELLAGGPFNVVLQNRAPKEDDGSLSRICAARGLRYVNIEAALGNTEGQRRMLQWTERVL